MNSYNWEIIRQNGQHSAYKTILLGASVDNCWEYPVHPDWFKNLGVSYL